MPGGKENRCILASIRTSFSQLISETYKKVYARSLLDYLAIKKALVGKGLIVVLENSNTTKQCNFGSSTNPKNCEGVPVRAENNPEGSVGMVPNERLVLVPPNWVPNLNKVSKLRKKHNDESDGYCCNLNVSNWLHIGLTGRQP